MEERAKIAPGLPRSDPTTSYWTQERPADVAPLRTTPHLPSFADFVIVGAGISGTCIALNLHSKFPEASVVLLEARAPCSGATGRNGGHTKAASYRSFLAHERAYGTAEAVKIARLEYANMKRTHEIAKEYNIDCASTPCQTVDVLYSQYHLECGIQAIKRIRETLGPDSPAAEYHIWTAEETHDKFFSPNALGAFSYPAGSLNAYEFTTGLLARALDKGLNLQTETPVISIAQDRSREHSRWRAETLRGSVSASHLVLATNGYTAHLLPEFQGLIVPLHGQVVAQRPGTGLPQTGLPTTYSYILDDGYEYMITRPPGSLHEGDIVIGGGIHKLPDNGASRFGNTDDTSLEPTITEYLRRCTVNYFGTFWGDDHPDGRMRHEWCGIMGASADGLPYVGQVPGKPGLWMSASFNGHGMVWCLKSAEALVEMITGDDEAHAALDEWFPKPARLAEARMNVLFTGGDWQASAEPHASQRSSQ